MTVRFKLALTVFATGLITALLVIATVLYAFQRFEHEATYRRGTTTTTDKNVFAILPLLDTAVQLRQRDNRDGQLLGENFQTAGNLGNFCRTVLFVPGDLHELQVIDHDEIEAVFAFDAASARAQLRRCQRRRLVDENLCF